MSHKTTRSKPSRIAKKSGWSKCGCFHHTGSECSESSQGSDESDQSDGVTSDGEVSLPAVSPPPYVPPVGLARADVDDDAYDCHKRARSPGSSSESDSEPEVPLKRARTMLAMQMRPNNSAARNSRVQSSADSVAPSPPPYVNRLPHSESILIHRSLNIPTETPNTMSRNGKDNARVPRSVMAPAPPPTLHTLVPGPAAPETETSDKFTEETIREFRAVDRTSASNICGIDRCTFVLPPHDVKKAKKHVRDKHYPIKDKQYTCRRPDCPKPKVGNRETQWFHMETVHLDWRFHCPDPVCRTKAKGGKFGVFTRWHKLHDHLIKFCGRKNHMSWDQVLAWAEERKAARELHFSQGQERVQASGEETPEGSEDLTRAVEVDLEAVDESPIKLDVDVEAAKLEAAMQFEEVVALDSDEYDADTDDSGSASD